MNDIGVGARIALEDRPSGSAAPRLSVVIPTRNEAANVGPLCEALRRSLSGIDHEVIVVDDSTDSVTRPILRALAAAEPAWRIIERGPDQTGLATAVALGISLARGSAVCVMDGDLQHPADAVPRLLHEVEAGADLAVASRYAPGGASDGLDGAGRRLVSRGATWAAIGLFPESRRTTDPLSGFFCVRRDAIVGLEFRPVGFKILLELLVLCPELRVADVPFVFGRRAEGTSKAGVRLGALYVRHLASLFLEVPRSSRRLKFGLVTALSAAVFLACFAALSGTALPVLLRWLCASAASSVVNGVLQRRLTFPRGDTPAILYRALGVSGCLAGVAVYQVLLIVWPGHSMITAAAAQAFALGLPLVLNLPTLRRWRRAFSRTSGHNLEDLRQLVRADGAWCVSGEGQGTVSESADVFRGRLADLIMQCAATQVPDLIIQSPSPRPQPRRNIEMASAILVPDPSRGTVAVLVRYRRKPFRLGDLSQAIAWLYDHRLDPAAEPPSDRQAGGPMTWSRLPLRIGAFGLVGVSGVGVNQLLLWGLVEQAHVNYLVAAVLASVGSTTTNFILTELWVFRSRSRRGVGRRFLEFAALTAATTPVRLPILFVLTSVLGVHYLISNLVALGSLFGGRYLISSLFIWGRHSDVDPLPRPAHAGNPATLTAVAPRKGEGDHEGRFRHQYDIDGLVRVASELRLPELEFFRTADAVNADLTVCRGVVGSIWPRRGKGVSADERHLLWREQTAGLGGNFRIDFGPPVRLTVAPLLGMSPHVVYTNLVEPLLRFLLVQQNRMLLHAATIVINGETITLSAKTDTGKTGTILRLLQAHGGEFYSDDMVILDGNGLLSRYPKPLTLSAHTVPSTPTHRLTIRSRLTLRVQSRLHSRQGRAAGKWLGKKNLPIMSMNAIVQALCPPPKYVVTDLVSCQIGSTTRLQHLFIIDRAARAELSPVSLETGAQELSNNTDDAYGFPPYASLAPYLKIGGTGCDELTRREQKILTSALKGLSPWRIVVQDYSWAAMIEQRVGLGAPGPEALLEPAGAI